MTKQDYLNELKNELTKNAVADAEDILMEYEQHFQFKLADGFSEEEIATKLGAPAQIAAQYVGIPGEKKAKGGKKFFLVLWLTIIGLFEVMLYGAFLFFIAGLFAASLVPAALGVELIAGLNYLNILPPMPYGGAIVFGITLLALSVILVVFAICCFAYLRQKITKAHFENAGLGIAPRTEQEEQSLCKCACIKRFFFEHRGMAERVIPSTGGLMRAA